MGSAIPAATAALVAKGKTAVAGFTFQNHPVTVIDGPPESTVSPTLCIGLPEPPDVAQGPGTGTVSDRQWYAMGAAETLEEFVIPCYIDVIKPGTEEAMVAVRVAASDIFDLFWAAIRSDPSLGGLVSGLARVSQATYAPSGVAKGGQQGRRMTVLFGVKCLNEYVT